MILLGGRQVGDRVVTAAMFRTWDVRLPASPEQVDVSVRSFRVPATLLQPALITDSMAALRATLVTSEAKLLSWSTMMLIVLELRISPLALER